MRNLSEINEGADIVTKDYVDTAITSHTHGYLNNNGTFSSQMPIANGDYLVIADHSNNDKLCYTTLAFDGSTTTKALTQKGTWETFSQNNTTYTIGGALSSHKFTITLNPSLGTSSSAKLTLAAGTGITITDDTENNTMTIASTVTNTDEKVKLTSNTGSTAIPIVLGPTSITSGTAYNCLYNANLKYTPSTGNLQTTQLNGVAVGSTPKFTDTVTTVTSSGSGNVVTGMSASNGAITYTMGSAVLTGAYNSTGKNLTLSITVS